jgi:hypothetical protein
MHVSLTLHQNERRKLKVIDRDKSCLEKQVRSFKVVRYKRCTRYDVPKLVPSVLQIGRL